MAQYKINYCFIFITFTTYKITLFFPNITTAFFQHTENNRKIASEQLKSKFLTVALCIKVEHADAEPRSSSPEDRQAVSLLSTGLALAWTTTVSVKLSFHRIINTSYRRNSPSFSHLAPDLHWVSAPTLFPFSQVSLWVFFSGFHLLLNTQLPSLLWLRSEKTGRATRLHFLSEPTG